MSKNYNNFEIKLVKNIKTIKRVACYNIAISTTKNARSFGKCILYYCKKTVEWL